MTNNIAVCFYTYAGGIAAGLGTIFLMFTNGMSVGVITTACTQNHMALSIWSFVAAHGALEIPSIFISGGAGLRLASGLLFPACFAAATPSPSPAANPSASSPEPSPCSSSPDILEAFLSPTHARIALKFSVSAVLLTGLGLWLSEGGREKPAATSRDRRTVHSQRPRAAPAPSPQDTY